MILEQVALAYKAIEVLECEVATSSRTTYSDRPSLVLDGKAVIRFQREGATRVSGKTPGGAVPSWDYEIVSDHGETTVRTDFFNSGKPIECRDMQSALLELNGVTLGAPLFICSWIMDLVWSGQTRMVPSGRIQAALELSGRLAGESLEYGEPGYVILGEYAAVPVEVVVRKSDYMIVSCKCNWSQEYRERSGMVGRYPIGDMIHHHKYTYRSISRR